MLVLRPQKQIVFSSTSSSDQAGKYWLPVKRLTAKVRPPTHSKAPEYPAVSDNFGTAHEPVHSRQNWLSSTSTQ